MSLLPWPKFQSYRGNITGFIGDFSISHTVCRIRCHFSYSHIYVGSVVFKNWLIRILKQRYVDLTSSLVQYWVIKHNRSKLALQNREKQIITHNVNKRITRILCIHHQDLFALVGLRFDHQDQGRVYSVTFPRWIKHNYSGRTF